MNRSPLRVEGRLRACALGLLLASATGSVCAESLQQVLERAWAIYPIARTLAAKEEEVAASRTAAGALLPGSPKIGVAQRTDRWNDNRGALESELEISLPLWLPGQKAARQAVAEAEGVKNRNALQAARLALAGELRAALWTLQLARSEAEIAAQRLDTAASLEADVARRVKVGEMARADLLLAKQETAAARAARVEAQSRAVRAARRYRVVTGSDTLPDDPEEAVRPVPTGEAADHPRLAAGRADTERARAGLRLAQESRRDAPELGVQYRREREESNAPSSDSIRFGITIPLATEARNAPLITAANTGLIQSEADYQRLVAEISAGEGEAVAQLEAAQMRAELAVEREQAATERFTLLRRSFELGETALVELLRAQSQAAEARLELARSRIQLFTARANVNQARGITP